MQMPMARDLWRAMEEAWPLPAIESIKNNGSEWILQAFDQVHDDDDDDDLVARLACP
jgi:hypothetical protein